MIEFIEYAFAQGSLPEIRPLEAGAFGDVRDVLQLIVRGLLYIAGGLAVIYLIWSGFQYMTAAGDPEKAQKARSSIIYAIVGIIVIMLSFVIVNVVANTLRGGFQGGGRSEETGPTPGQQGPLEIPPGQRPYVLPQS